MRRSLPGGLAAILSLATITLPAGAGITTYGNGDRDAWFEDVGDIGGATITTIGFRGPPGGTHITDQYSDLGVTFDGQNVVRGEDFGIYHQDGWGLRGLLDIAFEFDSPQNAIAVDFPGDIQFDLYRGDELIHSVLFIGGSNHGGNFGNFAGVITLDSFDRVTLVDFLAPPVFIDDLHFASIPAPGALVPLLIVSVVGCRGRRRAPVQP